MRRALPLGLAAGCAAASMVVGGQALHAKRRRDLPTAPGCDASGEHGDPSLPKVSVVCMGDSTLTGPGLDGGEQTWIRLALADVAHDRHVTLRSLAVGGSCVQDVYERQLPELSALDADVVVVAVGSNDVLRWTPRRRFAASMARLVGELSDGVAQVVIGGVGDLGAIDRVSRPLSDVIGARARQIDRIIRATTAAHANVAYIDVSTTDGAFRSGGRALFTADRFHPNSYGHRIWAAAAAPVLANSIRRVSPR